jgi:hypothetical protein
MRFVILSLVATAVLDQARNGNRTRRVIRLHPWKTPSLITLKGKTMKEFLLSAFLLVLLGSAAYAGAVTQLGVVPSINPVVAGTPITITVSALDANGLVVPGYRGTVHFTSDSQLQLPADYTYTARDNGVHTFDVILPTTAGDYTITATDTANSSITGSATITVIAAPASQFTVVTDASDPQPAGVPFDVTVIATDPYGNVDTNYTGTVTFSSQDPAGATLPANYTFQPSDQGQATFAGVSLYTEGTWDVTATDTVSGITGSAFVNVQAAPAVARAVIAPRTAHAGVAVAVTVIAQDPYDNTDTNDGGTITWTTSDQDPNVVLPPDYPFQPSDQGQVTFPGGATLITPGDQFLTASDRDRPTKD